MGLNPDTIPRMRKAITQLRVLRPDIWVKVSMVFDPSFCSDLQRDLFVNYWAGVGLSPIDFPDRLRDIWVIPAASAGRGTVIKIPRVIPCRSIFSDLVIGFDGKLSSCCFDPNFSAFDLGYYSGNILKDWHSEQFQKFRQLHNEGKRQEIPLCKECTFE